VQRLLENMNRIFTLALIVLGVSYGCLTTSATDIAVIKERHESWLMSLPSVVGTGVGDCQGKPCIKVYVKERTPELQTQVPKQLEGFEVDVEVTGPIETLSR
jgi:hypothetical protein